MTDILDRLRNRRYTRGDLTLEEIDGERVEAAAEIERLRALVKKAADAYENGDEDECCVVCMELAEIVRAEQKTW